MKFADKSDFVKAFFQSSKDPSEHIRKDIPKHKMAEYKNMQLWVATFCEEKGIDLGDYTTNGRGELIQIGHVVSEIISAPYEELKAIMKKMIWLDFKNQPIEPFIEHLAKALK
jgi:hypothetical protein